MDRAFQRLPWGHYISPVVPNTMNAQLAYARLFMEEKDAENGFPWGETIFAINKGFLKWLLGSLYILYLCAWLSMCVFLVPMVIEIIALLSNSPTIAGAIKIAKGYGIIYLGLSVLYFVGKYGRLFLASFNEKRLRSDPTSLYRREGLVRIKQKDGVFEAPFIEFDAYRIHTPSGRGGRYYNLLLQHRYSNTQLWMKGLVTDAMNPKDINAYWSMIQQYMDVSGPLPDVPIFEPFRQRDPVTEAADRESGRDPFFWRNMSNDQWRAEYESDYQQRLQHADFNEHSYHSCILDAHIQGRGLPLPDGPQGAMLA